MHTNVVENLLMIIGCHQETISSVKMIFFLSSKKVYLGANFRFREEQVSGGYCRHDKKHAYSNTLKIFTTKKKKKKNENSDK